MKRFVVFAMSLGLLTAMSTAAEAAPITINVGSISGGTGVLHAPGTIADGLNVYLGAVSITGDLGAFDGYCVDLQHYELHGPNVVTLGSMSDWNNTASPPLPGLGGGAASWLYNRYAASSTDRSSKAALSLAIWNSLYDDDYTVRYTSGINAGFWVTSLSDASYATRADVMLAALAANTAPLPNNVWLQTQNVAGTRYAQDFIGPTPVPEPSTVFLLGLGMAFAAGFKRKAARSVDSV